jgi:hypothetical protein
VKACEHDANPSVELTEEWRQEAIIRLFKGIGSAHRCNGTSLRDCWVPVECIDPDSGEIFEEKNSYCQVRIQGEDYKAHTAVFMLVHNRHPLQTGDWEKNEVGMHLCNSPACRYPIHLKFGSRQEDSDHKVACGRASSGMNNGRHTKPERSSRGENHYAAKLKGENHRLPEFIRLPVSGQTCHPTGLSQASIRRAIKRGLLKPCRAFRHPLIPAEELQALLKS